MTSHVAGPPPIAGVIFDFHATLVDERDLGEWVEDALRHLGRTEGAATHRGTEWFEPLIEHLAHIWEHAHTFDPNSERDLDPTRHREVFAEAMALLPGTDPGLISALYAVMPQQWVAFDDTLPVLKTLRERGVRIVVLSNIGIDIRGGLERQGIAEYADGVVLSFEVGAVKPQPEIFQRALDLLEVPASQTLMVGDSWRADAGAGELGIRTLILPRTRGTIHGLDAVLRLIGERATGSDGR